MSDSGPTRRLASLLRAAPEALLDWLYPRHCYHCDEPLWDTSSHMLCPSCWQDMRSLRIVEPLCTVCGIPLIGSAARQAECLTCRSERRFFDVARALFAYAGPVGSVIKSFKFEGDFFLGPRLLRGVLKLGWLPDEVADADAVVPVPLHPRRRRQRGYDQALLLARAVASHMQRPLLARSLVRTRYTSQQALLPAGKRWDNVRGAFAVRDEASVRPLELLLVDDVMTTGETAGECARALKRAGARRVAVLTVARTAP